MEIPREYYDVRKNATAGVIENEDVKLHFSEWWNGEGVDFTFTKGMDGSLTRTLADKHCPFSMSEMTAIVTVAMYMGMIDMEEVEENVRRLENSMVTKKRTIGLLRNKFHIRNSDDDYNESGRDVF